eukprot:TRINITY_DN13434_c0_g1_i1.p1 TRINITY_DN13434_c0_g1~~TRINITY_DN13434_c0_g1_i1.p1  ORF type:complete len:253 (+),score=-0.68 TRINITY_DN13434_c0_g1_i1:1-759(+)
MYKYSAITSICFVILVVFLWVDRVKLSSAQSLLTLDKLRNILPAADPQVLAEVFVSLIAAMKESNIVRCPSVAAFISQSAMESGMFAHFEERLDKDRASKYPTNGNNLYKDDTVFKGRGTIKIRGRLEYARAGKSLRLNLEKDPNSAAERDNAVRIGAWYWNTRGFNWMSEVNTEENFEKITNRIVGCSRCARSHYFLRRHIWKTAVSVLKCDSYQICSLVCVNCVFLVMIMGFFFTDFIVLNGAEGEILSA